MPDAPQGGVKGKTQGSVHPVFTRRLTDLREQAKKAHNALQGKCQREWQIPADFAGSLLDIATLHQPAFERTPINDNYETVTKDPQNAGTVGDVISLKLQIDYNACEERAFRARHTTLCRAMCIAHGRRFGQGQGNLWDQKTGIEAVMAAFGAAGGANQAGGAST